MNKKVLIILGFGLLIALLAGYYFLNFLTPKLEPKKQQIAEKELVSIVPTKPEIFYIGTESEGWSKEVLQSEKQQSSSNEIIEFKNGNIKVTVSILTLKSIQNKSVYTGYIPETREFLYTEEANPVVVGNKDDVELAKIKQENSWVVIDKDSYLKQEGKNTYIYELPLLVKLDDYTIKTTIKYESNDLKVQLTDEELKKADDLVLSLKSNMK